MSLTLLLDLDDTLLGLNQERFLPAYYDLLADDLCDVVEPEQFLAAFHAGIASMMLNRDPTKPLQRAFEEVFYSSLTVDPGKFRERLLRFYREVFPSLARLARVKSEAPQLVEWALGRGHRLVLATEPVFPLVATLERVRWAGLRPEDFALISSFETFHFPKQQAAYFAEVLGRLGWPEGPVLMAGNDIERDLIPARELGLSTFYVVAGSNNAQGPSGELGALQRWISAHENEMEAPSFGTPTAILGVLESTPAALQGMTVGISAADWTTEPGLEEWAMIELACHLRDTEREVHAGQLRNLIESAEPFVARPDAAYWAKQRRYLNEDGPAAITQFARARLANLETLRGVPEEVWSKTARHAIFGPSSFREVVGFMAEHDRLHLEQAWRTLNAVAAPAHRS